MLGSPYQSLCRLRRCSDAASPDYSEQEEDDGRDSDHDDNREEVCEVRHRGDTLR